MGKLRDEITKIGKHMVKCRMKCDGVEMDAKKGILPRCLILQGDRGATGPGVIVCGLNPSTGAGTNRTEQRQGYLRKHPSYDAEVKFWHEYTRGESPYYRQLTRLVKALGINGPILWTDTVKCQKADPKTRFSHSKFRATVHRCVGKHLRLELAACPDDWIAIGVGNDAFSTLTLVCPERFVLGVPHPTGLYSAPKYFEALFDDDNKGRLRPELMKDFRRTRVKERNGLLQWPNR